MEIDTCRLLYDLSGMDIYTKTCARDNNYLIIKRTEKFLRPEQTFTIGKLKREKEYGIVVSAYKNSVQLKVIRCEVFKKMPNYKKATNSAEVEVNKQSWLNIPWSLKYSITPEYIISKTKKNNLKVLKFKELKPWFRKRSGIKKKNSIYNFTKKDLSDEMNIKYIIRDFLHNHYKSIHSKDFMDSLTRMEIFGLAGQRLAQANNLTEIIYGFVTEHYSNIGDATNEN